MRTAAIAILTLAASAAPVSAQGDPDSATAAASISRAASAFSRALERGDAEGMAAQYVDDATLVPPNGRLVEGKPAILVF